MADRGFSSYVHLALLCRQKLHAVFRVHQRQLVSFRRDRGLNGKQPRGTVARWSPSRLVRKLARYDQIVEYRKPVACPLWLDPAMFAALPDKLCVRELRYHTCTAGFRSRAITLVTTLLDADEYTLPELASLYRQRWEIETNFAHLKTTMGMHVLRCHSVEGVLKELAMFALVYNLARLVMLAAACGQSARLSADQFCGRLALARRSLSLQARIATTHQSCPQKPHRAASTQTTPKRILAYETTPTPATPTVVDKTSSALN